MGTSLTKNMKVNWYRIVWFSQDIPRYSFLTWLAVKGRLSTSVRTRQWGHNQACLFCGELDETRDHLFFGCPYSFMIWINVSEALLHHLIIPDW